MITSRITRTHRRVLIGLACVVAVLVGVVTAGGGSSDLADAASGRDRSPGFDTGDGFGGFDDVASDTTESPGGATGTTRANGGPRSGGGGPSGSTSEAPVIEDAGVSSNSLHLLIEPMVSDPDGDEVTVAVVVDGNSAVPRDDGSFRVDFDRAMVGLSHDATVAVTATDATGTASEVVVEHRLQALDSVQITSTRFTLERPEECFGREAARRVTGFYELRGPVARSVVLDKELRPDQISFDVLRPQQVEVPAEGREPVKVVSRFVIGDVNDFHIATTPNENAVFDVVGPGRDCAGEIRYTVSIAEV